jgi:pimeloyl-ACP methyl ester carboxylesterase
MRVRTVLATFGALAAGTLALNSLAAAIIRRYEDLDPETVERPGGMVYVRGTGLHYVEQGAGPPLVLVHGFLGSTVTFRELIERLAPYRRTVALDLPGFGYSDRPLDIDRSHTAVAELLCAALDRLGIARAAVLGHSMGGVIAARLAVAHPERVERLILVGSPAPDEVRRLPLYPLLRPVLPILFALTLANLPRLRRSLRGLTYDPTFLTDDRWQAYTRPSRLRGSTYALIKLLGDIRRDVPLDPARIGVRTLLLWGEADTAVPLRVAHRLHALLPDARLEVVPRAGHLVLEEQPDASADAILRFLGASTPTRACEATP